MGLSLITLTLALSHQGRGDVLAFDGNFPYPVKGRRVLQSSLKAVGGLLK